MTTNLVRKARNAVLYAVQGARVLAWRTQWRAHVQGAPRLAQPALIIGSGHITFDDDVTIGYFPSPHFVTTIAHIEARGPRSSIHFGRGTIINNGFVAIAEHTYIQIGKRALIGTQVEVYDSDFHGLSVRERRSSRPEDAAPVIVEDDAFIGSGVRILKGVTVGQGAVVATASVVTRDIPAFTVAAGSPARVMRHLDA